MKYIRIIGILILCLLLPLGMSAKRSKKRIPDKPVVADSILQNIFQFSPFYSRIIDEYKSRFVFKKENSRSIRGIILFAMCLLCFGLRRM